MRTRIPIQVSGILACGSLLAWLSGCATPLGNQPVQFATEVKPVLEYYCIECHTDRSRVKFGGLSLETGAAAMKTGWHAPVIIPGDPEGSLLYKVLRFGHDHPQSMPPAPDKISDEQLAVVYRWIRQGAIWPTGPEGHLALPR